MTVEEIHAKLGALPEPQFSSLDWPDYASLGFGEDEVEELLNLMSDFYLSFEQSDEESALSIHAWRALATMGDLEVLPEFFALSIECDDIEDEWVADEFPELMSRFGMAALPALKEAVEGNGEYPCLAEGLVEALPKMVVNEGERETALLTLKELSDGKLCDREMRGLIICALIELKAVEMVDEIREQFAANRVNVTLAGDLEEVEIALGLREKRETSKPNLEKLEAQLVQKERKDMAGVLPLDGSLEEKLQFFLIRYGLSRSLQRVDQLNGFLLSLAISGRKFSARELATFVWDPVTGSEKWEPDFESAKDEKIWLESLKASFAEIRESLKEGSYVPHVSVWPDAEDSMDPEAPYFTPWLEGFMRGEMLQEEELEDSDEIGMLTMEIFEKEEEGIRLLEDLEDNPVFILMDQILRRFSS